MSPNFTMREGESTATRQDTWTAVSRKGKKERVACKNKLSLDIEHSVEEANNSTTNELDRQAENSMYILFHKEALQQQVLLEALIVEALLHLPDLELFDWTCSKRDNLELSRLRFDNPFGTVFSGLNIFRAWSSVVASPAVNNWYRWAGLKTFKQLINIGLFILGKVTIFSIHI